MKDKNSFEDNIKHKMEEFNDVPSPKIWQRLEQSNSSNYSINKKSFIMKSIPIISVSIMSIFLGYYFINKNSIVKETPLDISFDAFFEASEFAEKEGKILYLHIVGEDPATKNCPEKDCPPVEKTTTEINSELEIEKIIAEYFIKIDIDINNNNYDSFFDKYGINSAGISLFFKDGKLNSKLNKINNLELLKDYLYYTATGEYQGMLKPLNEQIKEVYNKPITPSVNNKIQAFLDAKDKAEKEGKIIIIKATMEGCTFCGKMEKETYLTDEVQAALDDKFIILDVDINDENCHALIKYYQLNAAPISLFINHDGEQLAKVVGVKDKDHFLEAVELALEEDIKLKNNTGHFHHEDRHGHTTDEEQTLKSQKKTLEEIFMRNEKATVNKGIGDYEEVIEKMKAKQKAAFNEAFGHSPLKLKAYPNPNNGSFKLDIEGEEKEGFLYFSNQKGDVLLKEKIDISPHTKTLEYDFPHLNGAIFLRLEQGKNVTMEKIFIQN